MSCWKVIRNLTSRLARVAAWKCAWWETLDTAPQEAKVLVQSHFEGEAWGLEPLDDGTVVTCGDDNRVMMFDSTNRQFVRGAKISDKSMKVTSKMSNASTM